MTHRQSVHHRETPQDVYARHLSSRRGYPLWMPELSTQLPRDYQDHGLKIGDVGYVDPEEGCFEVLFNICLPLDHDLHRDKQLPRNFQPVALEDVDVAIYLDREAAGNVIKSTSVTTIEISPEGRPSDFKFTFSSSEGALLILPQGADRHSLRRLRAFARYATQHAVEWYRFVEEDLEQIISNDSLYLITGFYKARSWALAAFEEAEGSENIPAQFKVTQSEGGAIARGYNWNTTRHSESRVGPSTYNGNPNQAVYIRGFKVAVRDEPVARKHIVVKADHPSVQSHCEEFTDIVDSQDPGESGSGKSTSSEILTSHGVQRTIRHVSLQHVPQASQLFHPSDIINRYLLQKEPSATVAITHDCQWAILLKSAEGNLEPHDLVDERLVVQAISERYDITLEDGAVFLHSRDISDPLDVEGYVKEQSLLLWDSSSGYRAQSSISTDAASSSHIQGRSGTTPPLDDEIDSDSSYEDLITPPKRLWLMPPTLAAASKPESSTSENVSQPYISTLPLEHKGVGFESSTSRTDPGKPASMNFDVLSWTNQDPREGSLFNDWGVLYRFVTVVGENGQSITTLWRAIRANKEDRVAKLDWAANGGLGRAVIGKNTMPMSALVRPDPRYPGARTFNGPDGIQYRWRPSTGTPDVLLEDPAGNVVAIFRPTRPTRYQMGDVYGELHFLRNAGAGTVTHPPLMDMVTVTAMLYRFCQAFGL